MREALKVGRRLKKEGVLGRFALDFVTVLNDRNEWEVYAIEINLRKGGTTHPFLTLQFLTDGAYDAETGVFRTPRGETKCFVASDHVHSPPIAPSRTTTCSTSSRVTACTSISRARRASSFTWSTASASRARSG